MKFQTVLGIVSALLVAGAAVPSAAQTTAQDRMRNCAQEWSSMRGANQKAYRSYREFSRECLARSGDRRAGSDTTRSRNEGVRNEDTRSTTGLGQSSQPRLRNEDRRSTTGLGQTSEPRSRTTGSASAGDVQRNCPGDSVVWANTRSKVYHMSGSRLFGNTKEGTYMCRSQSERMGYRAARNERLPERR